MFLCTSSIIKCLGNVTWKWRVLKTLFDHPSRKTSIFISILQNIFRLPYCLTVSWWLQIKVNWLELIKKTAGGIFAIISHISFIFEICQISWSIKNHQNSIFKFRLDSVNEIMSNDIWRSYKLTTLVKQNSSHNAVF